MAYQNPGRPKFYVDHGLWLYSSGYWTPSNANWIPLIQLNPATQTQATDDDPDTDDLYISVPRVAPITYIAFLGIKASRLYPTWFIDGSEAGAIMETGDININGGTYESAAASTGNDFNVSYDGWCLTTFKDEPDSPECRGHYPLGGKFGAISIGSHYTLPHSSDIKITMSREMDGIKRTRTRGGSDLINHKYHKPAMWGDLAAWELGTTNHPDQKLSRTGRRVWSLSFSFFSGKDDVFGVNQMLSTIPAVSTDVYDADDYSNGEFTSSLLTGGNFYSQVISRLGGRLPFIFQPDSSDTNIDNFAICKFDMSKFSFQQTSPGLYSCKLKIREIW